MEYKVGDVVTIRECEDMEQEFGSRYTAIGNKYIDTIPRFVGSMQQYCGKKAVIVDIYRNAKFTSYHLQFDTESGTSEWNFSEQMFVGYRDEEMIRLESHAEESDIVGFLFST